MRHLSSLVCAGLVTLGSFAACGSDDGTKKEQDGDAGAGGVDGGSGGDTSNGGSSNPGAGEGGVQVVAGQGGAGAPPLAQGGEGGASEGGTGGVPVSGAGEGGGGGVPFDCPAQPGTFDYSCGVTTELHSPTVNLTTGVLSIEFANLEFPIASGSVSYFYSNADFVNCGTTTGVQFDGTNVTTQLPLEFVATQIRIADFDFVDVCGSHHVFDEIGVACYELNGTAGAGTVPLFCQGVGGASCPAACE